ncbi:phosphoserine phosphatase SerB [Nakamurella leprariae]|uniref:phosphoserine phosphatase n=1 Tax=Nakamurella leprariae TaxID=2803911 RepID=A0A938YCQ4_9ACTN|nr:phosphoserine phosphatase SerB [Nakamurella leprariae]MBM9467203.1 phosphoserine phosphatase SerB [Nakamurella leprariae]
MEQQATTARTTPDDGVVPGWQVLVTVTGPDQPGVTGRVLSTLAGHGVEVIDIDQAVIRGMLTLGVLVIAADDPADAESAIGSDVRASLDGLGMTVRVQIDEQQAPSRPTTHAVVVLGRPLRAAAMGELALRLGTIDANINAITRLADYPVTGLELSVSAPDDDALRVATAQVAAAMGVDIAVERAGLERRAKRLIVFDVDSTLITGEVIEMLAEHTGALAEVEHITAAAMRGELDFEASLRARVAMLAGLDAGVLDEIGRALPLTPGARTTVRTLKRLGYRCGIVSGGFTQVARHLVAELDLDFVAANTLEVIDGRLTGNLVGDIVDRAGKARALTRFALESGVALNQTVAVGDGANDIDMLTTAGLGIAFNAKPVVAEHADTTLNQPFLDPVLFILGISREEIEAADVADGSFRRVPLA